MFAAIAQLLASGAIVAGSVRIVLRATGHDAWIAALIESHAAKRQSPEAEEGLASFAQKRAAKWTPK